MVITAAAGAATKKLRANQRENEHVSESTRWYMPLQLLSRYTNTGSGRGIRACGASFSLRCGNKQAHVCSRAANHPLMSQVDAQQPLQACARPPTHAVLFCAMQATWPLPAVVGTDLACYVHALNQSATQVEQSVNGAAVDEDAACKRVRLCMHVRPSHARSCCPLRMHINQVRSRNTRRPRICIRGAQVWTCTGICEGSHARPRVVPKWEQISIASHWSWVRTPGLPGIFRFTRGNSPVAALPETTALVLPKSAPEGLIGAAPPLL